MSARLSGIRATELPSVIECVGAIENLPGIWFRQVLITELTGSEAERLRLAEPGAIAKFLSLPEPTKKASGPYPIDGGKRLVQFHNGLQKWVQLVELHGGIYCNVERTACFRYPREKAEPAQSDTAEQYSSPENEKKTKASPLREMEPGGMPVLHYIIRPTGVPERDATDETIYGITWSDYPGEIQEITETELNSGKCWARFAPLAISSKAEINLFANIVKAQGRAFGIKPQIIPRRSGLYNSGGKWIYIFPNDKVHGYDFPRSRSQEWEVFTPPQAAPSANDLVELGQWLTNIDPKGRHLILAGLALRSLLTTISPIRTAATLIGEGGAGKTGAANFVRGVLAPCNVECAGDANFTTPTHVERTIRPLGDMPILIDDAHPNSEMGAAGRSAIWTIWDRLTMAPFNDQPMHGRGTRGGGVAPGTYVAGLPIGTFNSLDGARAEQIRRWVYLPFAKGEIDYAGRADGWDTCQPILTAAGHAVIREALSVLNAGPAGESDLRRTIGEADKRFTAENLDIIRSVRENADPGAAHDIARNLARAMTGAWFADQASGAPGTLVDYLSPHISALAATHIDALGAGNINSIDADFVHAALREAFARDAYLLDYDTNMQFTKAAHSAILDIGYRYDRTGNVEARGSRRAGWFHIDGSNNTSPQADGNDGAPFVEPSCTMYLFGPQLLGLLEAHRGREGGEPLGIKVQTLPAVLAALSISLPGQGGRNTYKIRQGRQTFNVIAIPYGGEMGAGTAGTAGTKSNKRTTSKGYPVPATKNPENSGNTQNLNDINKIGRSVPAVPAVPAPNSPYRRSGGAAPDDYDPETGEVRTWGPLRQIDDDVDPAPPEDDPGEASEIAGSGLAAVHAALGVSAREIAPPATAPAAAVAVAPAAAAPKKSAAAVAQARPEVFAVLGLDGAHISDARQPDIRLITDNLTSPHGFTNARMVELIEREGITQLWRDYAWCAAAGAPEMLDRPEGEASWKPYNGMPHHLAEGPMPAGWRVKGHEGRIYPWLGIEREGGGEVAIVTPHLGLSGAGEFSGPLDARLCLEALLAFRQATAFPFRINAPTMLGIILEKLHKKKGTHPLDLPPMPAALPRELLRLKPATRGINWGRVLTEAEQCGGFLQAYDANMQYLAAMSAVDVGYGLPARVLRPHIDLARPGWWQARVDLPPEFPADLPDPRGRPGPQWYPTPWLAFLVEIGCAIDIEEAWLFSETRRPFDVVYTLLRRALGALSTAAGRPEIPPRKDETFPLISPAISPEGAKLALDTVKLVYSAGTGNLSNRHPYIAQAIVTRARANMMRHILKAGLHPFAIRADALYIVSPNDDPIASAGTLPLDTRPGHFKLISEICGLPVTGWPGAGSSRPARPRDLDELKLIGRAHHHG